jgi:resuscitation-promoting factor RpfA
MSEPTASTPAAAVRAALLLGAALAAAALTWRLKPAADDNGPVGEIVLGCGWLAWLLAGWLTLSVAGCAAGHLGGRRVVVGRCVPRRLSRLVDAVVTAGLVGAVLGGAVVPASAATAGPGVSVSSHRAATGDPLDWPGLADRQPARPLDRPPPSGQRHRASRVGLVAASPRRTSDLDSAVTVRSGDSLWSIAAAHLGRDATAAQIAAAWPRWFAENRRVVGDDPTLILPGQRLHPPSAAAPEARPHRPAGSS